LSPFSRREFLKASLAVGTIGSVGNLPLHAAPGTATDTVPLGKSGLQVTRLALGTGSNNGQEQSALGQQEFTRLVRYAYDRGIRFFETSESYSTPAMLGTALKGIPRESWQHSADWAAKTARWQDGILEAQAKKIIRVRGASVHGLPALRLVPGNKWLEVAMIRMNHNGTAMDGPTWKDDNCSSCVSEVVEHVRQVRKEGMGVISMKLIGAGAFKSREDRQAAMRFAFRNAGVDCVTVGFTSTQQVDEAIDNLNLALA
jgi:hypothetical protein